MTYYDLPGTRRASLENETWARLLPLFDKVGITRVAHLTGLDTVGIAVTTCVRPNAKHLSVSQGKGLTERLAAISAVMESLELYHAENTPPPTFTGNYEDLKNRVPVIAPSHFHLPRFTGPSLNQQRLGWVPVSDLMSGNTFYLPYDLVSLDSTQLRPRYIFFTVSSNGLAAGNTREEAICHALYELIERDALTHWQKRSPEVREKTRVSIKSIHDLNAALIAQFHRAGLHVKIWDLMSRFGIPSFHCALYDNNVLRGLGLFTGTGTHLVKEIALSRALTEVAQGRITLITGNRDDIFPDYYKTQARLTQAVADDFFLTDGTYGYDACIMPSYEKTFSSNIHQLQKVISKIEDKPIFIYEHTKKELGIPVVQLLAPGFAFNGRRM